jgi:hypothetical protein
VRALSRANSAELADQGGWTHCRSWGFSHYFARAVAPILNADGTVEEPDPLVVPASKPSWQKYLVALLLVIVWSLLIRLVFGRGGSSLSWLIGVWAVFMQKVLFRGPPCSAVFDTAPGDSVLGRFRRQRNDANKLVAVGMFNLYFLKTDCRWQVKSSRFTAKGTAKMVADGWMPVGSSSSFLRMQTSLYVRELDSAQTPSTASQPV